ncbi:plasmid mobilization protein [Belnapia rosea]|uniref:plasmid mobilization protein n=1 Tax=Belnapia rosea TaxID=938405 RepID=UPI0038CFF383
MRKPTSYNKGTPTHGSDRRDRHRPMAVYVSDTERAEIERRAELANRSCSDYLRSTALECAPQRQFDRRALLSIIHLHELLCRVELTLKQMLAEHPETTADGLYGLLARIPEAQQRLAEIVGDAR